PTLVRQWWRLALRDSQAAAPPPTVEVINGWCRISAGENLTLAVLNSAPVFWSAPPDGAKRCILDLAAVRSIDATGIALLVRWKKALQQKGGRLVLLAPGASVRLILRTLRLDDYFSVAEHAPDSTQQPASDDAEPVVLENGATRSLAWRGEIVAANVEDVWEVTTRHVKTFVDRRATLVIVDLGGLRFIDSSGASLMLRLKKWAQQFPAEILFTHAQPNVRNVLRLTRLDQVLLEGAQ
ncbi:MAG: STAS domain-containing protein, partial [Opitutaceae bacterium]